METITNIGIGLLRVMPIVLLFYAPALPGMALLRERGGGYRVKAGLWFAIGFGTIVATQLLMTGPSVLQAAQTVGISLFYIAVALALAAFTVYRLSD
jgi:hypothetical protein